MNRKLRSRRRLNEITAYFVLFVVALSPVPFASNRPFYWSLWAVVIALWFAYYVQRTLNLGATFPIAPMRLKWLIAAWLIFTAAILAQSVPWGWIVAVPQFHNAYGNLLTTEHLSLAPEGTILAFVRAITTGLFGFLALQIAARVSRQRRVLQFMLAIVAAHAFFGLIALTVLGDTILFLEKWDYLGSATGTFVNRNSFATFLSIGLAIGVSLAFGDARAAPSRESSSSFITRLPTLLATAVIFAALVATQSRMGVTAGMTGALVVILIHTIRFDGPWRHPVAAVAVLGLGAFFLLLAFGSGLVQRIDVLSESIEGRIELYRQTIGAIQERWLLGYGGDTFKIAFPLFHLPSVPTDLVWDKAHSTYLGLWFEYGLVIGSIPIILIAACLVKLITGLRDLHNGELAAPAAAIGAIVVVTLHSLADFSMEIQANVFLFTAVLGLGTGGVVAARDTVDQPGETDARFATP